MRKMLILFTYFVIVLVTRVESKPLQYDGFRAEQTTKSFGNRELSSRNGDTNSMIFYKNLKTNLRYEDTDAGDDRYADMRNVRSTGSAIIYVKHSTKAENYDYHDNPEVFSDGYQNKFQFRLSQQEPSVTMKSEEGYKYSEQYPQVALYNKNSNGKPLRHEITEKDSFSGQPESYKKVRFNERETTRNQSPVNFKNSDMQFNQPLNAKTRLLNTLTRIEESFDDTSFDADYPLKHQTSQSAQANAEQDSESNRKEIPIINTLTRIDDQEDGNNNNMQFGIKTNHNEESNYKLPDSVSPNDEIINKIHSPTKHTYEDHRSHEKTPLATYYGDEKDSDLTSKEGKYTQGGRKAMTPGPAPLATFEGGCIKGMVRVFERCLKED